MAVIKAKCPMCGGTIIIPDGKILGECDSCAIQFSLSDLQKMREDTGADEQTEPVGIDEDGDGLIDYRTALSTDGISHETVAELCKKAEIALGAEKWSLVYKFCDEIIRRDPHFAKAYLYKLLADCKIFRKEALANCQRPFDDNENYRLLMRFADTYLGAEIESYLKQVKNSIAQRQKEQTYQKLCGEMSGTKSENVLRRLIKSFTELGDYRDSEQKRKECEALLQGLQKEKTKKKRTAIIVAILIALIVIGGVVGLICSIA